MAQIDAPPYLKAKNASISTNRSKAWFDQSSPYDLPNRRKRSTRSRRTFTFTVDLTPANHTHFESWVAGELDDGLNPFNWIHTETKEVIDVVLETPPTSNLVTKWLYRASLTVRER